MEQTLSNKQYIATIESVQEQEYSFMCSELFSLAESVTYIKCQKGNV